MLKKSYLLALGLILVTPASGFAFWSWFSSESTTKNQDFQPFDKNQNRLIFESIRADLPHLKPSDLEHPHSKKIQINPNDKQNPEEDLILRFGNPKTCKEQGLCLYIFLQGTKNRYKVVGEFNAKNIQIEPELFDGYKKITLIHANNGIEPLIWAEGYYVEEAIYDEIIWQKRNASDDY